MLAAHFENLLFLLLVALAGLFQLLGRAARKKSGDEEKPTPTPAPRTLKPIPRAPAESDEERVRKFLEALGQPAASRPPRPVMPRTDVPPRPLAPVQPPPVVIPGVLRLPREQLRKPDVARRETPPPEIIRRAQKIFAPAITGTPVFEVHQGPLPIEQQPAVKTPLEAFAASNAFGVAKTEDLKTDIAALLASKSGLRDAIILREIFGPPRSLQPLDLR